jgi:CheY-like chemotaxis protein
MHGFGICIAKDGVECIEMVEKYSPDLIILDILLPKMTGNDALMMLKSKPRTKDIPVIMCTALNRMNEVEVCCRAGAAGYITKPYDLNRVIEKVSSITS